MATVRPVLEWQPITPRFGAELANAQLREFDDKAASSLTQLVAERGVVVCREQRMTIEDQIALGYLLGPIHILPAFADPDRPELLVIHSDEHSVGFAEQWHSDVSCEALPPAISMLRMEVLPEAGGDTLFADMYQAYASLSPAMRLFLVKLTAQHDAPPAFGEGGPAGGRPVTIHPVVRTHPLTGQRALFVNPAYTKKIVELEDRESAALLRMLFDQVAYNVDHQIRVSWRPGTVVMWDNRCVQHHATFDYHPAVRHGFRITTIGEAPYLQ
jgi:alpha-ketoglutarate-dependent taurine dioxygenase